MTHMCVCVYSSPLSVTLCQQLRSELSSLRNENSLLSSQLNLAKKESAVVRACLEDQLQTQTSADKALRERVAELEGVRDKLEAEQERVKVSITFTNTHTHTQHTHWQQLQHRLKQAKHDIQFAQSLQSKLLHGEDQERELKQLREENTVLRNHVDNVGLMQYQLQTLREQVERNEDMERRAVRLEEENKLLKEQLTSNEDDESSTGYVQSYLYTQQPLYIYTVSL